MFYNPRMLETMSIGPYSNIYLKKERTVTQNKGQFKAMREQGQMS